MLGKIDFYLDGFEFMFVIGGGFKFFKVSLWLEKKGFEVVVDSEIINV